MRRNLRITVSILILATSLPALAYRFIEAGSLLYIVNLLGYFTIESNILVDIIVIRTLLGRPFSRRVELAAAAAITVTALVFQLFLRSWFADASGLSTVVMYINHGSTTVLFLLWFLLSKRSGVLSIGDLKAVVLYPAIYCLAGIIEWLIRGEARYFFFDITGMGAIGSILWLLGLTVLFLFIGLILISIDIRRGTASHRG